MENEIVVKEMVNDEDDRLIAHLTDNRKVQYCSVIAKTQEEKIALFNAQNNPDHRLADMINIPLEITDVYAEVVDCVNKETGEVTKCPRIVLIDKDMVSYQAVSKGIFNSVSKLIAVFGNPHWDTPIVVVPTQITKGELKILTLRTGTAGKKAK